MLPCCPHRGDNCRQPETGPWVSCLGESTISTQQSYQYCSCVETHIHACRGIQYLLPPRDWRVCVLELAHTHMHVLALSRSRLGTSSGPLVGRRNNRPDTAVATVCFACVRPPCFQPLTCIHTGLQAVDTRACPLAGCGAVAGCGWGVHARDFASSCPFFPWGQCVLFEGTECHSTAVCVFGSSRDVYS